MAKARKDNRGRALRKGESQRQSDMMYVYAYTYTDPFGKRRYTYSKDLGKLREKEKKLLKDQLDGLDVYAAGNADLILSLTGIFLLRRICVERHIQITHICTITS